jgi:ATP-dependent RNA helicase RhlE
MGLVEPIVRAVSAAGYTTPTPIQAQAIPVVISGCDLLGVAQTGTGKTAAFALPIIQRLVQHGNPAKGSGRRIRVLVLSPTRELAAQIGQSFSTYGQHTALRNTVIFGGVNQYHQVRALQYGVDILVATPGRLMDLKSQGYIDLNHLQILVLDEADRMLDMGFLPTVKKIVASLPRERQTLFFSATMPPEIRELSRSILRDPASVEVAPVATTAERINQSVYHVEKPEKIRLLRHLLKHQTVTRALVFTRTKHGADKLARQLHQPGFVAEAIHGNRSQSQRERALANFKRGRTSVLVATDIAARGLDVDGISHVFNYDLPREPDNYVHRIGRTARAGASGNAISFCSRDERSQLKSIERLIRQTIEVRSDGPTPAPLSPAIDRDEALNERTSAPIVERSASESERVPPRPATSFHRDNATAPRDLSKSKRFRHRKRFAKSFEPMVPRPESAGSSGRSGHSHGRPQERSGRRSYRPRGRS